MHDMQFIVKTACLEQTLDEKQIENHLIIFELYIEFTQLLSLDEKI